MSDPKYWLGIVYAIIISGVLVATGYIIKVIKEYIIREKSVRQGERIYIERSRL